MTSKRAAGTALATVFVLMSAWPAAAETPTPDEQARASVTATLDDAAAEEYDVSDPLELHPDRELAVAVEVTNTGDTPLVVRSVRLEGRVLGMTFIDFDTRVDAAVDPGETVDRSYTLDVGRLNEQAIGLFPVELSVLDAERERVAAVPLVVDAQGSLTSAYGLFGLIVALATAMLLAAALVRLARGTLPEHRWYRAVRFAVPGAGIGLTVAVTLSVLRVMVPNPGRAVTIVVVCALAGLLLGFLTPTPDIYRHEPQVAGAGVARHERDADAGRVGDLIDVRDEPESVFPATRERRPVERRPGADKSPSPPAEQGRAPAEH